MAIRPRCAADVPVADCPAGNHGHSAQREPRLVHTTDIGVSYFLFGVIAVLAYRIATPWRWGYQGVLIAIFGGLLIAAVNFTAIGHFSAIFIGLMFYPMARRRSATVASRSHPDN